jgi:hypothetical protein
MSAVSLSRRVLLASLIATPALARPVRHAKPAAARRISVTVAIDRQGHATPQWIGLIRDRIDADELAGVRLSARALSADDNQWIKLIRLGAPEWVKTAGKLDAPFRESLPPAAISVVIGDGGGDDAFGVAPDTIAFDLSALGNAYGTSDPAGWAAEVGRLLSREYMRLRLNAHLAAAGWSPDWSAKSPVLSALRTLYVQGLANLRGIEGDPRWLAADGTPTTEAKKALGELEPVMVERLKALWAEPSLQVANGILRDMTVGPLSQRWGVLPITLWLAADTGFDPDRIASWIGTNPDGILQLAIAQADPKYQRAFADLQSAVPDKVAKYR